MHASGLKKVFGILSAFAAMGLMSACGQSRYQPVVAENVFAPAHKVDDSATSEVQTLFANQPKSASAPTYARTSSPASPSTASGTSATAARGPVPVVTRPRVLPVVGTQQASYNCAVAPTTQAQLAAYQRYCAVARPSGQFRATPTPADAPSRPVFVSRSFNCTMEPSNKAELTFFRAHCLAAVAAPIKAPVNTQVAARPVPQAVSPRTAAPQAQVSTRTLTLPLPRPRPFVQVAARPAVSAPVRVSVPAPAAVPASVQASQQPLLTGSFQPSTDSLSNPAAPTAPAAETAAAYDCNILPTTREELERYQVSCS